MKCIIIEDQLPAQRVILKYASEIPSITISATFQTALEGLEFLKNNHIELIFLDINLPGISGISFLRSLANPPKVIITSAYSQYALEGFELDVVDYLLKPFSFERFLKSITRALNQTSESPHDFTFIKSDKEYFQVKNNEICYLKADDDFTRVYTSKKMHLDNRTLRTWEEGLPGNFIRVHRSYIINRNFVSKIAGNRVFLDSVEIPIGRSYKDRVLSIVNQ